MKVSISVPRDVFEGGEQLARRLGVSRSQLYSDALVRYLGERGADAVTSSLDRNYSADRSEMDPALMGAQLRSLADEGW